MTSKRDVKGKTDSTTLQDIADKIFTKKLGILIPEQSHNSFRVMAARAKRFPKISRISSTSGQNSTQLAEETSKKIKDLGAIETQYSKYLLKYKSHDQLKDQKQSSQSFWTFIQDQPISNRTKQVIAAKLNTPFRINLAEFDNKAVNVKKFISLLDYSAAEEDKHEREEQANQTKAVSRNGSNQDTLQDLGPKVARDLSNKPGVFSSGSSPGSVRAARGLGFEGPKLVNMQRANATARSSRSPPSDLTKVPFPSQTTTKYSVTPRGAFPSPLKQEIQWSLRTQTPGLASARPIRSNSSKHFSSRLKLHSRQSPQQKHGVLESTLQAEAPESTWRPSFMQPDPRKSQLQDKIHQFIGRCDQMQQTRSTWLKQSTGNRWTEEKSLSRSSNVGYFKVAPYFKVTRAKKYESSTQVELSSFTPEKSSPTVGRVGLELVAEQPIIRNTAKDDAESIIRKVEGLVEQELEQERAQLSTSTVAQKSQPIKVILKRTNTNPGFSPRNNSPDNDIQLQANMLHNFISFGNPHATKKEVVEKMIEFKEIGGKKLGKEQFKMLAETRNFFITNAKPK